MTTLASFGTLDLSGGTKTLDGRTLDLQGNTTWTAGKINLKNAATLNNSGIFDVQSDVHLNHYSGDLSTFHNSGSFQKSGGSGTSDVQVHFNNAGSLQVLQGTLRLGQSASNDSSSGTFNVASGATLQFRNGTHLLASGSSVNGDGTVWFSGGTVTVAGTYNLNELNSNTQVTGGTVYFSGGAPSITVALDQSGGTLAGSGQLVAGLWTWTGGTQTGSGVTGLASGGTLDLSGGTKTLDGRTLDLQGSTTWTAGNINLKNAAAINNSGIFDVQSDVHLNHYTGDLSTFNNYGTGTFQKLGGSGTTDVEVHLHNDGSVQVLQGTLRLGHGSTIGSSSGAFTIASGANLRFQNGTQTLTPGSWVAGAGSVQFSGGMVIVAGDYDLSGSTEISGGTADFDSASSVVLADLFQSSGTLNADNDVTISGGWTRDGGTFNAGTGRVTFVGTSEQAIGGYAITAFYDLAVNNSAIVAIPADRTPIVTGALTNNGTLKQTRDLNNSGSGDPTTFSFLHILDWDGNAKHSGMDIRIGAGANMGSTTVYVHGNQTCGLPDSVKRCYEIVPSDIGVPSTVWFYYRAAEANGNVAPYAWHWDGLVWTVVDPFPTRGQPYPEGYWVRARGVNEYSPFALADDPSLVWHRVWLPMVRR